MQAPNVTLRVAATLAVMLLGAPARAEQDTVKVAKSDKVGSYLTDAKGMTLYVFKKDAGGKSACTGPCVTKWPIYFHERVGPAAGLKATDFGTITREDGQKQTTYKGKPLYYYSADEAPGDTKGQGFNGVWAVASP